MAKIRPLAVLLIFSSLVACTHGYDRLESFTNSLLEEVINRIGDRGSLSNDFELPQFSEYAFNSNSGQPHQPSEASDEKIHLQPKISSNRAAKLYEKSHSFRPRYDGLLGREPAIRDQEYLEHSSLFGHQYVQGGAGEGYQRLKPDGSVQNVQVVKSDGMLPAYCNPPNPCPLGYFEEDGCLEDFINTEAFSREYQAAQECMCDTEHMFDCPGATKENEIDALARSIQNEGLMDSALNRLVENMQPVNPFLDGEKLPVVAKKAPNGK